MTPLSKGLQCALGGFLVHTVLGTLYCWGNLTTFITAHLRKYDPNTTYEDTIAVYSSALLSQGVCMSLGGVVEGYFGARKTILIGGYLIVLGKLLAASTTSLFELVLFDGVMFGVGVGLTYSSPISCAIRWSPSRKSLYSGIIVAGFGSGAFLFGILGNAVVNPEGISMKRYGTATEYYPSSSQMAERVPLMYCTFAICFFVLITLGGMLIQDTSETSHSLRDIPVSVQSPISRCISDDMQSSSSRGTNHRTEPLSTTNHRDTYIYQVTNTEERKGSDIVSDDVREKDTTTLSLPISEKEIPCYNRETEREDEKEEDREVVRNIVSIPQVDPDSIAEPVSGPSYTPLELVQCSLAWHLSVCLVLTASPGMFLAGTYKTFGEALFPDETFLSTVGDVSALFNTGGRIAFGALADRIGPLNTLQGACLSFALVIATYTKAASVLGRAGFAIWTFLLFTLEGCNFALYPALNAQLFGSEYATINYGIMFSIYSVFTVMNITLLSRLDVNFFWSTVFISGVLCLGLLSLLGFGVRVKALSRS